MEGYEYPLLLLGSIVGLYAAKYAILRGVPNRWFALCCFVVLLAGQSFGLYATDPDYPSRGADPKAHWIGLPVLVLTVPAVSFLVDWFGGPVQLTNRYLARTSLELVVLLPAWTVFWAYVEVLILGWVYI